MRKKGVMKRLCSFAMAMVMMLSASVTVSARTYEDIYYYSTQYKDAISFVSDNGYMIGTTDTTFVPKEYMTRAMLVTVLHNMAKKLAESKGEKLIYSSTIPFTDVKSTDWFYNPIRWAYGNNMVAGTGEGKFSPHENILKQDAILILYKYAIQNGIDVDVLDTESEADILSEYTDVASISSYALKATKWAVEREIFPAKDNTTLEPIAKLERAQMALLVTEYGLNVEHIVYGRDNYNFTNHKDFFTDGCYYISDEHREKLFSNIDKIFVNNARLAESYKNTILEEKNKAWTTSCYGMTVTTILDKMGKIDFNGNFGTGASNMYKVNIQEGGMVESAINYYNSVQYITLPGNLPQPRYVPLDRTALQDMVEECKAEKGLKMFCYTMQRGISFTGHTVVVYDIIETSKGIYRMSAYDNRSGENKPIYITIDTKSNSCTVHATTGDEKAVTVCLITDFTPFDLVDIDAESNGVIPPYAVEEISDVTIFKMDLSGDFALTNAEGETLTCEGAWLSGDMEVKSFNIICNGKDVPAQIMIAVKSSSSYSYEALTEGMSTNLTICNDWGYASVTGTNVEAIQIDAENRMVLSGSEMEYEITYHDNDTEEVE